jgi:sulfur-carrier protein
MVNLLYFARLREVLGRNAEQIALPEEVRDVASLTQWLRHRGGIWETELASGRRVRVAVNLEMAAASTRISDGDEVAFFPPVTGG